MASQSDTWFVEPLKNIAHDNEVIARFLEEEQDISSYRGELLCADGRKHPLWDFPSFTEARRLWNSRFSLQIDIKIWCRGADKKIRLQNYILKNKKPPGVKRKIAKIKANQSKPK